MMPPTNILHMPNSRRHYDRLSSGLEVHWRGGVLQVANWSLGGLGIIFPNCPWDFQEEITLTIMLPVEGETFPLTLRAKMVHYDTLRHYVGLQFAPLPPAPYHALRYLFTQMKNQQEIVAADLLYAYHHAPRQENAPKLVPLRRPSSHKLWLGYGSITIAAAIVFYLVGTAVNSYFFTVSAKFAAVTAPAFTISAPADGIVETLKDMGDITVHKGAFLLRLNSPALSSQISLHKAEMALQQERVQILETHLTSIEKFFTEYKKTANSQQDEKKALLDAARASVTEQKTAEQRVKALFLQGHATQKMLDESKAQVARGEAALAAAVANAAAAKTNEEMAGSDFFFSGNEADQGTPNDIRRNLALANAEYRTMQRAFKDLLEQQSALDVRSPCVCSLSNLLTEHKAFVKAGQPLMELQGTAADGLRIEALVPQENVERLTVGNPATIILANTTEEILGTVQEIRRLRPVLPRVGLPLDAAKDANLATVLITTHHPLPSNQAGLPAQVVIDVAKENILFRTLRRFWELWR